MDRRGFIRTAVTGLAGLAGYHAIPRGAPLAEYEPEIHAVPSITLSKESVSYGHPKVTLFIEDFSGKIFEASGWLKSMAQHWPIPEWDELEPGGWIGGGPLEVECNFVVTDPSDMASS